MIDEPTFSSYSPCIDNNKIKVRDNFSAIAGKDLVMLSPSLTLTDVLHVLNISCSLMLFNKLAQEKHCQTNFFHNHYVFPDSNSRKTTSSGKECGRFYYSKIGNEYLLPSKQINYNL